MPALPGGQASYAYQRSAGHRHFHFRLRLHLPEAEGRGRRRADRSSSRRPTGRRWRARSASSRSSRRRSSRRPSWSTWSERALGALGGLCFERFPALELFHQQPFDLVVRALVARAARRAAGGSSRAGASLQRALLLGFERLDLARAGIRARGFPCRTAWCGFCDPGNPPLARRLAAPFVRGPTTAARWRS